LGALAKPAGPADMTAMLTTPLAAILAFCAAAALLTVAPGLDTALVVRTSASEGRRAALAASLGIGLGCLCWATLTALGLGALLAASELGYTILKWVGAAYLVWLGARLLINPRTALAPDESAPPPAHGAPAWLARGFLTNILNPKVGVFYVSFLPQFVPQHVPVAPFILLLGAIHAVMGFAWLAFLTGATRQVMGALKRPGVLKALDRVTGVVFLAFAARLALEPRR
jgi:threonine/homoserine/homoserine lactone efflux protein